MTLSEPSAIQNESDIRLWIETFRRHNGRDLRILHIGNIANNAFRNAAIQRRYGIAADVVCYDYDHVMGCPEWELNTIDGDYNAFAPDWWRLAVSGPDRPEWYIQGSQEDVRAMLRARISGSRMRRLRARLDLLDGMMRRLRNGSSDDILDEGNFAATRRLAPEIGTMPRVLLKILRKAELTRDADWWSELKAMTMAGFSGKAPRNETRSWVLNAADAGVFRALVRLMTAAPAALLLALCRVFSPSAFVDDHDPSSAMLDPGVLDDITAEHRRLFPHATESTLRDDMAIAADAARNWADILPYYDIVQGYSVDGLIPLVCGHRRFLSYEHGTVREIPFEDTARGRLCWLTYRLSPCALITNSDVLPYVDKMGLVPDQCVLIPHAFDDSALLAFRKAHQEARAPQNATGSPVFFAPARHHWTGGGGSWEKGNDIYLRAAGDLAARGHDFRLVLVEWGQDVEASRKIIHELGIQDRVQWVPLLDKEAMYDHFLSDACVVDQFRLPALGGVGYEALTMGARVITRIDPPVLERFFGEAPPLLDAANVEQVAARMLQVLQDPADTRGVGASCAAWAKRYHSTERLMALQTSAYAKILQIPSGRGI